MSTVGSSKKRGQDEITGGASEGKTDTALPSQS